MYTQRILTTGDLYQSAHLYVCTSFSLSLYLYTYISFTQSRCSFPFARQLGLFVYQLLWLCCAVQSHIERTGPHRTRSSVKFYLDLINIHAHTGTYKHVHTHTHTLNVRIHIFLHAHFNHSVLMVLLSVYRWHARASTAQNCAPLQQSVEF